MNGAQLEVVGVPSEVGDALADIYRRDGALTVDAVVKEARKKSSPLHGYFEWNLDKAAAAWRREQAENLIRRVHVKVIPAPESKPVRVRAYIANRDLPPDSADAVEAGSYTSLQQIFDRGTTYQRAVEDQVRRDLLRLQVKYEGLEVVWRVLSELRG